MVHATSVVTGMLVWRVPSSSSISVVSVVVVSRIVCVSGAIMSYDAGFVVDLGVVAVCVNDGF
ncbi:hypothetical protein A2U01_0091716, partial [Trifolium medium]|nr:hypothetical protein [Trifolium medium]